MFHLETLLYVFKSTLNLFIEALSILMLLRAIWSWIDQEGESRFSAFLYTATEPIIMPIRALCVKMNWFQQTPLDIPFLIAVILLWVIQAVIRLL